MKHKELTHTQWERLQALLPPQKPQTGRANLDHRRIIKGGLSTKIHLRAAGDKHLMTFVLTPGQGHEAMGFEALVAGGVDKRCGRGRPKQRPARMVGDKAYSSRHIRGYLRRRGIRITIPHKKNGHRSGPFNRAIYRLRERVERLINRLKQNRRIATRYDKCAEHYRAMWLIAATRLWA